MNQYCRGFTLVELLLVLFILSVAVTFVTLLVAGSNHSRQLQNCADKLLQQLRSARAHAILEPKPWALKIENERLQFLRFQQSIQSKKWIPVTKDKIFRPFLPKTIQLRLSTHSDHPNMILLSSSGELTPFQITLTHHDLPKHPIFIRGARNGTISLQKN